MAYRNNTGKTLYVDITKTRVVEEGSLEAAFVLVGPGSELDDAEAKKYGLGAYARAVPRAAPPVVTKAVAPKENK